MNVVEGRPFGERLMCFPLVGAEEMKKSGWERAQVVSEGVREDQNCGIFAEVVLFVRFRKRSGWETKLEC